MKNVLALTLVTFNEVFSVREPRQEIYKIRRFGYIVSEKYFVYVKTLRRTIVTWMGPKVQKVSVRKTKMNVLCALSIIIIREMYALNCPKLRRFCSK